MQSSGTTKAYQRIVTVDFETYYSSTYSLRNKDLNTSEYIRHSEFKVQCVGIKIDDGPVVWVDGKHAKTVLDTIDWKTSALLCHHTAFDGFILSHHFGIVPAYYLDTLSMARAILNNAIGVGLDEVANFFGLGNKLPDVLGSTKGVRDLDSDTLKKLGEYCAVDTQLCRAVFDKLIPSFPERELDLIDLTVRMFCVPTLSIDTARVQVALDEELKEKARLIDEAGVSIKVLSSADQFAEHLKSLGVDPPRKISPTTEKETHAFSKTDLKFLELLGHEDPRVRAAVKGRLAAKSTIGETRAKRFLDVGRNGQKLPVYLNYFGAHTGRWSAGNKMNLQNLKRKSELRKSILAPRGHVLVVADSAQIEARTLAWLAGDMELLTLFKNKQDVYKYMASKIYGVSIENVTDEQRFIGKIAILGLGYGMGWRKFQHTLRTGAMGPPMDLTDLASSSIVAQYRTNRPQIVKYWRMADKMLEFMYAKRPYVLDPIRVDDEYKLHLPNGTYLYYPYMQADVSDNGMGNFRYYNLADAVRMRMLPGKRFSPEEDARRANRIYGGLLTENITQALARIIISEQMLEIHHNMLFDPEYRDCRHIGSRIPGRIVTMTHDEIVACVREEHADEAFARMISIMKTPPSWCKDLPLNAEGGYANNYSK